MPAYSTTDFELYDPDDPDKRIKFKADTVPSGVKRVLEAPDVDGPIAVGTGGGGPHTHPQSEVVGLVTDLAAKAPLVHSHAGIRNLAVLGSDIASAAVLTFANITGLSFPVVSGTNYRFYALILYTTSAATIGLRVSLTGPAMTHLAYTTHTGITAVGSAAAEFQNYQFVQDAGTISSASLSTTQGNLLVLEGICRPSANGTVQLRFAPETATANGVIIEAGSSLEWW